jgi:hypothetical protein
MTSNHHEHAPQYGQGALVQGARPGPGERWVNDGHGFAKHEALPFPEDKLSVPCVNCGSENMIPATTTDATRWVCWDCGQPQSLGLARQRAMSNSGSVDVTHLWRR